MLVLILAILISRGGTAVAHVEEGGGGGGGATPNKGKKSWVFFCPNIIPGKLVRVRVYCNFVSYSDANLLHVIKPSADCIEPRCPPGTVCGGGMPVPAQCIQTAEEQEDHAGAGIVQATRGSVAPQISPPVLDTIGTDKVFGYRSKITPHYDTPVPNKAPKRLQGRGNTAMTSSSACKIGPVGFKKKTSRQLVDVLYCHIATPVIKDALCCVHKEK